MTRRARGLLISLLLLGLTPAARADIRIPELPRPPRCRPEAMSNPSRECVRCDTALGNPERCGQLLGSYGFTRTCHERRGSTQLQAWCRPLAAGLQPVPPELRALLEDPTAVPPNLSTPPVAFTPPPSGAPTEAILNQGFQPTAGTGGAALPSPTPAPALGAAPAAAGTGSPEQSPATPSAAPEPAPPATSGKVSGCQLGTTSVTPVALLLLLPLLLFRLRAVPRP